MKILYFLESQYAFTGGCWFYRNKMPANALKKKGHEVKFMTLGTVTEEKWKEWPDVVVFSRYYPVDPLITMREYKKAGKKTVYEVDDNLWDVNPDNPSVEVAEDKRRQYENLMKEVDVITTTTEILAKRLRKFNKNVHVCPNAIDYELYTEMPKKEKIMRIGYSGAASHYDDLTIITEVLLDLQKRHKFEFVIQGMTSGPIESEMYIYTQVLAQGLKPEKKLYLENAINWFKKLKGLDFFHVPFYPPELFPAIIRRCNLDIGLAPLKDNKFNQSKSCVKFYEYASVGAVTLASKVFPYKGEVGYCAKNTFKDWKKKLEKLIVDKEFRMKLLKKQQTWVKENRNLKNVVTLWEDAFDPKQ